MSKIELDVLKHELKHHFFICTT